MIPAKNPEVDAFFVTTHGGAFGEFVFRFKTPPASSNLARVIFQWRSSLLDETLASIIATITSDDAAEIVIDDAATWGFTIKRQMVDLPIGECFWCLYLLDDAAIGDPFSQGTQLVLPAPVIVPP